MLGEGWGDGLKPLSASVLVGSPAYFKHAVEENHVEKSSYVDVLKETPGMGQTLVGLRYSERRATILSPHPSPSRNLVDIDRLISTKSKVS